MLLLTIPFIVITLEINLMFVNLKLSIVGDIGHVSRASDDCNDIDMTVRRIDNFNSFKQILVTIL